MRNNPGFLLVLLCHLLVSCARPVPPNHTPAVAPRFVDEVFAGPEGPRRFKLYVPGSHHGERAAPLLVMLHGCTQDPADFAAGTRMNELAETERVIVVYPEQPAAANPQKCWNWHLPAHQRSDAGEPALIAGITRDVMSRFRVDPARVYVAGISAGGAMALAVAATYPDLYAAVAVHSGVPFRAATNVNEALVLMRHGSSEVPTLAQAVPLFAAHGAGDAVVNPANTTRIIAQWVVAMGLDPAAAEQSRDSAGGRAYTRSVLRDRTGNVVAEGWTVEGLGHAWSGGSPEGTYTDPHGPDASRAILRFLLQHTKQ